MKSWKTALLKRANDLRAMEVDVQEELDAAEGDDEIVYWTNALDEIRDELADIDKKLDAEKTK